MSVNEVPAKKWYYENMEVPGPLTVFRFVVFVHGPGNDKFT